MRRLRTLKTREMEIERREIELAAEEASLRRRTGQAVAAAVLASKEVVGERGGGGSGSCGCRCGCPAVSSPLATGRGEVVYRAASDREGLVEPPLSSQQQRWQHRQEHPRQHYSRSPPAHRPEARRDSSTATKTTIDSSAYRFKRGTSGDRGRESRGEMEAVGADVTVEARNGTAGDRRMSRRSMAYPPEVAEEEQEDVALVNRRRTPVGVIGAMRGTGGGGSGGGERTAAAVSAASSGECYASSPT